MECITCFGCGKETLGDHYNFSFLVGGMTNGAPLMVQILSCCVKIALGAYLEWIPPVKSLDAHTISQFQVQQEKSFYLMAGIVPMLNKKDWHINKKCCFILFRATVVFLLVATSIGCYFAASRNSIQHGNLNDFDVVVVTGSPDFGKLAWSKCIYWSCLE